MHFGVLKPFTLIIPAHLKILLLHLVHQGQTTDIQIRECTAHRPCMNSHCVSLSQKGWVKEGSPSFLPVTSKWSGHHDVHQVAISSHVPAGACGWPMSMRVTWHASAVYVQHHFRTSLVRWPNPRRVGQYLTSLDLHIQSNQNSLELLAALACPY